ncbi:MAG: hypothetical protein K5681_09795 [Treponema sp.]|nr:hypothetical protein [Treponema sp.]
MSFDSLAKEVQSLPAELQSNIEMYALFVINQFKKSSKKAEKKRSASEIVDSLTGIISLSEPMTMKDIREERLSHKYGC